MQAPVNNYISQNDEVMLSVTFSPAQLSWPLEFSFVVLDKLGKSHKLKQITFNETLLD